MFALGEPQRLPPGRMPGRVHREDVLAGIEIHRAGAALRLAIDGHHRASSRRRQRQVDPRGALLQIGDARLGERKSLVARLEHGGALLPVAERRRQAAELVVDALELVHVDEPGAPATLASQQRANLPPGSTQPIFLEQWQSIAMPTYVRFKEGVSASIFDDQDFSHQTEWSGSARVFKDGEIKLFFTDVAFYRNADGSNAKPYDPRIALSTGEGTSARSLGPSASNRA